MNASDVVILTKDQLTKQCQQTYLKGVSEGLREAREYIDDCQKIVERKMKELGEKQ